MIKKLIQARKSPIRPHTVLKILYYPDFGTRVKEILENLLLLFENCLPKLNKESDRMFEILAKKCKRENSDFLLCFCFQKRQKKLPKL